MAKTEKASAKKADAKSKTSAKESAEEKKAVKQPAKAEAKAIGKSKVVKTPKAVESVLQQAPPRKQAPTQQAPTQEDFDNMEEDFSDVPQEVEQFSPVPMASRLNRPSVRYSDDDLAMFRKHIEAERKKALEEFQILRENLEDLTNSEMADENASYSMHMAEQGTDAQEKEKLYAHVQRVSDYIKKLDEALQRINDKVYGICKMCGILIAKERLLAVPITTQSASYKMRKRCPEDGIDRIVPVKK
jgi:RNA polymerase-binding transcription factor DksA